MNDNKTQNDDPTTEGDDPHYFVMKGRRWRRSDPNIPPSLYSELVKELMSARRDVGTAKRGDDTLAMRAARNRVQDAKVALGERGHKWWLERDNDAIRLRLAAAIRTLLRKRGHPKTICPSDAARVCDGNDWHSLMKDAKQVALQMVEAGWLEITQKGQLVSRPFKGAIRLRQVEGSDH